jgi:hypothetical protein
MKTSHNAKRSKRGSALLTIVFLMTIMALLSASIITYSTTERRGNERNRVALRAKNMAENIALYTAEQLTTKIYRLGSTPVGKFPIAVSGTTGGSSSEVHTPPAAILTSECVSFEMLCGIEAASAYALVTDTSDPNVGLQVGIAKIPIIAKATANQSAVGNLTAYVQQDMEIALTPLFQFGIFYNMDMEFYPSEDFAVAGPVHSNYRLLAHTNAAAQKTIDFLDRVSIADHLIADHSIKARARSGNGSYSDPTLANGQVTFKNIGGTQTSLKDNTSMTAGAWRDHRWKTTDNPPTASELASFKSWVVPTFGSNLRTSATGVSKLELPGIGSYKESNDPSTTEDDRSNGRQLIESPDHKRWNTSSFAWTTDTAALKTTKISWRAGLYIVVNPDDTVRTAKLPDGVTIVNVLPHSYRVWLNTPTPSGGHSVAEVVLPGQPSYGYNTNGTSSDTTDDYMYTNNLPNRYNTATSLGSNQVLRIAQQPYAGVKTYNTTTTNWDTSTATTLPNGVGYAHSSGTIPAFPADSTATPYVADAYFFDMRRANTAGVMGTTGAAADFSRSSTNFIPRAISKIDVDMQRLKMALYRVKSGSTAVAGYYTQVPTATNFPNSIYNESGSTVSLGLGLGTAFDVFPTSSTKTAPDPFQIYFAPADTPTAATQTAITTDPRAYAVSTTQLSEALYDGVAIYIHSVDAEELAQTSGVANRVDSGVRLWNGRGLVASFSSSGDTGSTICTNDAVYIVGHYNANGAIISDKTNNTPINGYSARYPDSANEKLCAVMGDAVTILSQPVYTVVSGSYAQTKGWCDAYSALPFTASSNGWKTSGAGSSDGVYDPTGIKPGALPNNNTPGANGNTSETKLSVVATEISTAMLVGIVPSNHNPAGLSDRPPCTVANNVNSGGANNFPRLLEPWGAVGLYIRGSMVALFESRVAMEPFTHGRAYSAPSRYWGLHYGFSTANHDIPLEPIVLSANRMGFRELSQAEYNAKKTSLTALSPIP